MSQQYFSLIFHFHFSCFFKGQSFIWRERVQYLFNLTGFTEFLKVVIVAVIYKNKMFQEKSKRTFERLVTQKLQEAQAEEIPSTSGENIRSSDSLPVIIYIIIKYSIYNR